MSFAFRKEIKWFGDATFWSDLFMSANGESSYVSVCEFLLYFIV